MRRASSRFRSPLRERRPGACALRISPSPHISWSKSCGRSERRDGHHGMAGDFTFGIEEEYFLVDARTKRAVRSMPESFFKAAEGATDGRISREFLQAQIEVITSPHALMAHARAELKHLRQVIAAVAAEHGLAILACGTHPTAEWGAAEQTAEGRYDAVMADLQMIGRRD